MNSLASDQGLEQPVEFFSRVEVEDDLALPAALTNLHAGPQSLLEAFLGGSEIGVSSRLGPRGFGVAGKSLRPSLGVADGEPSGDDGACQLELVAGIEGDERSSVPHGEVAVDDHLLDGFGKLQETEGVGDRGATSGHFVGDLFLGEAELFDHELVGLRFFDRAQVVSLNILDQGQFEHVLIGNVLDDGRDLVDGCTLAGAPAPFSGDDLVTGLRGPDDDRLEDTLFTNRGGELIELVRLEAESRLKRVGVNTIDVDHDQGAAFVDPGEEGIQAFTEGLSLHGIEFSFN